jgi:hypothetical protein
LSGARTPDGIQGCLFDLDGVITKTASVHDAARVMSTACANRSWQTGEPSSRSIRSRTTKICGREAARADGARLPFLQSRESTLPEATPRPAGHAYGAWLVQPEERDPAAGSADGVEVYPGSVRYARRFDSVLRRAGGGSSANTHDARRRAQVGDLFEG